MLTRAKNLFLPEVASDIVPSDIVVVLVVEDGQAGLVVELLQAFDGDADVELGRDRALANALVVVRLRLARSKQNNIYYM
jgi:hypothetical protein